MELNKHVTFSTAKLLKEKGIAMEELNKEIVPYKESLALKELGFDGSCFAIWSGFDEINFSVTDTPRLYSSEFKIDSTQSDRFYINDFKSQSLRVAAPTFSQAFRWFREKHNLKSWVQEHTVDTFIYEIRPHKLTDYKESEVHVYEKYEEAELACLKKLIEIVKNNKL